MKTKIRDPFSRGDYLVGQSKIDEYVDPKKEGSKGPDPAK